MKNRIRRRKLHNEKSFKNLMSMVTAAAGSLVRSAVGMAILGGVLTLAVPQQLPAQQLAAPQQAAQSGPSVTVVNSSANPVPVVGTISIGGAPTVNAQQSGS